jgi:hypothetical protein
MKWEQEAVFGSPQVLEACRSLALLNNDIMVVVGNSEPGGLFAGNDKVQFGFGMAIEQDSLTALTGALLFSDQVPYPIDVVADGMDIYVTSMASNNNQENSIEDQHPNWTWRNKYGSTFEMTVEKLSLSQGSFQGAEDSTMSFRSQWTHHFPVDPGPDGTKPTVYVGGIILKNNEFLVVAGSTRAMGDGYGCAEGDDEDGYLTLLDPATGELLQGRENNERYGTEEDDVVSGICDDPNDPNSIYIVGATKGDNDGIQDDELDITPGSSQGFISKINLTTLHERWTVQWGAHLADSVTSNYALGCHVEAGVVYVAGVVGNSAGMVQGQDILQSHGGDDIWVAQLVGHDGTVNWIKQVGTPGDDHLARGGGITSDKRGNAIVFGDTTGALYRERDTNSISDLFVMTLDHEDGHYAMTVAAASAPAPADPIPASTDPVPPPTDPAPPPTDPAPSPTNPDSSSTEPAPVATNISDDILATQTGPDVGPSYAGGMTYDPLTNSLYVTGATYGTFDGRPGSRRSDSACFFGVMLLPEMQWQQREIYGIDNVSQACNGIAINNYAGNSGAIIVGATEEGGMMTNLGDGNTAVQYGFAVELAKLGSTHEPSGGALMDGCEVNYPIAVVTQDGSERVYVVSMSSPDENVSADYEKVEQNDFPNFTTGGIEKFGSKYRINVQELTMNRLSGNPNTEESSFQVTWTKPFETPDMESVFVSGMIMSGETLVVVGSTDAHSETDMDGIMAKFNPDDGSFSTSGDGGRSAAYFASVTNRDDWIMGACPDPDDPNFFYVVGATKGVFDSETYRSEADLTVHAITAKIYIETLTAVWTRQFSVIHASGSTDKAAAASAFGCAVVQGQQLLYVAGVVENGATLEYAGIPFSAGKDDIFVAQLSTAEGSVNWLRQIGSHGNDRVARGGGVVADAAGNAVVFGDTTGQFYRDRSEDAHPDYSDVFVLILDQKDGNHQQPLQGPAKTASGQDADADVDGATPNEWYSSPSTTKASNSKGMTWGIAALFVCCFVAVAFWRKRRKQKRARKQKKGERQKTCFQEVGSHGTYTKRFARGINNSLYIDYSPLLPDHDDMLWGDEDMYGDISLDRSNSLTCVAQDGSLFFSYSDDPLVGMHHADLKPNELQIISSQNSEITFWQD